jgi:hypothetical protein
MERLKKDDLKFNSPMTKRARRDFIVLNSTDLLVGLALEDW